MSHRLFGCYGGQTPRSEELDQIFADSNRLIYSVDNKIKTYGNGFGCSNFVGSSISSFSSRLRSYDRDFDGFGNYREFNALYVQTSSNNMGNLNFMAPTVSSNRQGLNPYAFGASNANCVANIADPFISSSFINTFNTSIDPVTNRTNLHFLRSSVAGGGALYGGGGGDVSTVGQFLAYPTLTNYNGGHGDGNEDQDGNRIIFNDVSTNLFNRHRRRNALLAELRTGSSTTASKHSTDRPSKPNVGPKKEENVIKPYFYHCPICLDSVQFRKPYATNCGHVFCAECISIALTVARICPVCMNRLTKRRLFRIYL
ncbi:uncharacterized protein [Drosophila tropicalis]|uniref:uncharacterized protein n=1 Tax=Drosophila tropicalis TaxID=46794 RepID=UPI0035AB8E37